MEWVYRYMVGIDALKDYPAEVMRNDSFFHAYPVFMTDSPVLGEYLSQQRFRSEVQGREWGVEIRIYDVLSE